VFHKIFSLFYWFDFHPHILCALSRLMAK
jgi:hypothetical protein